MSNLLRNFVVTYDDTEYPVVKMLDAQDAAQMACQRIYSDTAGEAFDAPGGKPTRVTVTDPDGAVATFDVHIDFSPTFWAQEVQP